jgi:hypothetical protein
MVAGHLLSCMIMRSEAYSCRTGLYSASNTSTTPMAQSRSIT